MDRDKAGWNFLSWEFFEERVFVVFNVHLILMDTSLEHIFLSFFFCILDQFLSLEMITRLALQKSQD